MAKKKNGNKVWIMGAVLGAVTGAAYALWKTPMSGQELRGKLSAGPVAQREKITTTTVRTPTTGDTLLSRVEQTLAPVVGVQLGKTANGPAPVREAATGPISVPNPPGVSAAQRTVAGAPKEEVVVTTPDKKQTNQSNQTNETEKDPKFNAADATPDPGRNAPTDTGTGDSIRAKRFAWGSPTPEAGVQPVPTEPMAEDPVTEPAIAREPAAPAQMVPPGNSAYGGDTIRAKRFTWGEPTPDAVSEQEGSAEHDRGPEHVTDSDQPRTDQLATAASSTTGAGQPLDTVSEAAATSRNTKRQFPKLGGLENN